MGPVSPSLPGDSQMPTRSKHPHSPTRRGLMKGAAALSLAPMALPAGIAIAADKPAAGGVDAPKLKLGFIGVGKMGSSHLNGFVGYPNVDVVAVCDVDTTRREHF